MRRMTMRGREKHLMKASSAHCHETRVGLSHTIMSAILQIFTLHPLHVRSACACVVVGYAASRRTDMRRARFHGDRRALVRRATDKPQAACKSRTCHVGLRLRSRKSERTAGRRHIAQTVRPSNPIPSRCITQSHLDVSPKWIWCFIWRDGMGNLVASPKNVSLRIVSGNLARVSEVVASPKNSGFGNVARKSPIKEKQGDVTWWTTRER